MSSAQPVSEQMQRYFAELKEMALDAQSIAARARKMGFDPTDTVEIPFADDLAGRVENLVGPPGIAKRIRELSPKMSREKLMFIVAGEVAREIGVRDQQKALDQATRTGLAILTEGVLVAPLEGIAEVKLGKNPDGTNYADVYFAGPIRAAGGTAQAVSVLIADQVRGSLGIGEYRPTEQEVQRYIEEFQIYKNTQYRPSNEEIAKVVRNCPVCINGEGTEKEEVQGNRDLPRVPTNQVRSGVCLVIAEGILLKAKKLIKITKSLEIKGWEFLSDLKAKEEEKDQKGVCNPEELLEQLISLEDADDRVPDISTEVTDEDGNYLDFVFDSDQGGNAVRVQDEGLDNRVEATMKYIMDLIAGRPVLSHPSRPGGFRLRYGRGRTCGLAAIGMNPYTLRITDQFLALGTQVKIERPGKAGAVTAVDSILGPTVLMDNGDLVEVNDDRTFIAVRDKVRSITDLGELLIPFGEFAENNHPLVQGAYTVSWWLMEVQLALFMRDRGMTEDPYSEAYTLEERTEAIRKECLIPVAALRCRAVPPSDNEVLEEQKRCEDRADFEIKRYLKEAAKKAQAVDREVSLYDPSPYVPKDSRSAFKVSEELGVPLHPEHTLLWHDLGLGELGLLRSHVLTGSKMEEGALVMRKDPTIKELLIKLCCHHRETEEGYRLDRWAYPLLRCLGITEDLRSCTLPQKFSEANNVMKAVNLLSGIKIMERAPTRIGARMGRPEKADVRKMKPPVHGIFPVGIDSGPQRLLSKVMNRKVYVNVFGRECPSCGRVTPYLFCSDCRVGTILLQPGAREGFEMDMRAEAERAVVRLLMGGVESLPEMKGVKGLISKEKVPERMEKGLLRAKHDVFVFRDGTIRYDMTDITLTHFRPLEVGASVERLKALGYTKDKDGSPLVTDDQVLELKVQDIIVNERCGDYLVKVSKFIDEELERIYGEASYYRASTRSDLLGHLAIGLAPHTSAGVLCRIVGYTRAAGCFGHPFFHAAKRRNCDGDEDAVMLLLDGLLNFSRKFLPERRGGQMDAPLVLSMKLDPSEVDKEAHNVDVSWRYPLDMLRATMGRAKANDYWMYRLDTVKVRVGTFLQYEGFGYTDETRDMNLAPVESVYKTIGLTEAKIHRQLALARSIRAVDEDDVAERVLTTHLLPDLIGNLRSFTQQSFRCTKCGEKYRRLPLSGKCIRELGGTGYGGRPNLCNNKLVLTVSEGSVRKYLGIAQSIAKEYGVSEYLRQRIDLMSRSIESIFPTKYQETTLESFM